MKYLSMFCVTAMFVFATGIAMADSIKGRVGVTGKIGFINPSNGDIYGARLDTDLGFIGGGGIIYGVTDNIAVEMDITHASFSSTSFYGGGDFNTTNISLGGQYRFMNLPVRQLVPYAGAGIDILINGTSIAGGDVDNVLGVHIAAGVDYFVQKELALTAELKGVIAPDADITDAFGRKVGNFDPSSLIMTFGARYFF